MANLVTLGNDTLEFETMKGYDYMNIFTIKNGKICGKDSFGNNLYFPYFIDCPINRIFISDKNENLTGYQKLKLNNSKYLYYTNESTEGYLFIDLKTSHNKKIPLEPRHSEYLMNLPFYEEIYSNFDGDNLNIFSVKYLGINTSSIHGNKINKYEKRMNLYQSLAKGKLALFCLINIFIVFFGILYYLKEKNILSDNFEIIRNILGVFSILIYLLYFIFVSICLGIHLKYITKFMNKINLDFEREKKDFKWNFIILIYKIIFFVVAILIVYRIKFYNGEKLDNSSNRNIHFQANRQSTDDINNNTNETLQKQIDEKEEQIKEKEEQIKEKDAQIEIKEKEINNLKKKIEIYKDSNKILQFVSEKEEELKNLKECINIPITKDEKLMSIVFQSTNQTIIVSVICTNKMIFNNVENKLYEKVPELKRTNTFFLANGDIIYRALTVEENKIKDGDKIVFNLD